MKRDKYRFQVLLQNSSERREPLWGSMRGTFKIAGDIVGAEWDEPHDPATGPDYRLEYGEPFLEEAEATHA